VNASDAERSLFTQLAWVKLPEPEREYRFVPDRRWRFDLAWPELLLAVEIEGGIWIAGRHSRGTGIEADMEKYNRATLAWWRVLRVTPEMVDDGRALTLIQGALAATRPGNGVG
jgi:hypothetical protein